MSFKQHIYHLYYLINILFPFLLNAHESKGQAYCLEMYQGIVSYLIVFMFLSDMRILILSRGGI